MENPSIGVFSSSSPLSYFFSKRMNKTREIFKNKGLIVNFGKLYNQHIGKYTTGTILERAQEFNELLKSNDILISSIGGFNSASILDKIDYDFIKQNKPKILGLSDATSILLAIYKKTGVPTFYGQSFLKSFDEQELIKQQNINTFFDLMISNKKNVKIKEPKYYIDEIKDWNSENRESILKPNKWIWLNKNNVTGRLIGGNLNTMISMLGTKYMPEIKEGDILFFEDSDKTIAECERNFASLKNSGILDIVSAIIVGKPEKINLLETNITYEDLFLKFIDRKIPIIMKFDCGHTLPSFILKIGGQINIDPDKEIITIF